MPLDEFKTQVLLLHSEQSALDNMGAGFSDNYTVHYATSGSEALNTLVETPINVIVSAQELPGMSGLEALREAKKRSPDTIGILLAGPADNGLEALVGDEEVFKVVRGEVSSDTILKLVENATRQMRLMALAESANDTKANPDTLSAEHIVMETSDNGSTIISDGTGRLPALDPQSVGTAASVGSRAVDVMVLTKDEEFLETVRESARGLHQVFHSTTLSQADETIRNHKVGVAVIDSGMVGDKVEQLTVHLRKTTPRLVSIVAGRREDGEMLMDLINRGKVYRFLLKPVSPGRSRLAIEASVKYHLEAPDAAFGAKRSQQPQTPASPQTKAGLKAAAKEKSDQARRAATATPGVPPSSVRKSATDDLPADPPLNRPGTADNPDRLVDAAAANDFASNENPVEKSSDSVQDSRLDNNIDDNIDDRLGDAFGEESNSFTETMTGIFSSVGEKFSGNDRTTDTSPQTSPEDEQSSDGSAGGPSWLNPKLLGIAATAIIVAVGAVFFLNGGEDESNRQAVVNTPTAATGEESAFEPDGVATLSSQFDIDALVDEARLAADAGQIYDPVGNNAIELYASAFNAAPDDSEIATEFQAAIATAIGMAETAMLESRLDDADVALTRVAAADPSNARIPFLQAQLQQAQLRSRLDETRLAIRENRFEDAAASLLAARNIGYSDTTEIAALEDELASTRSEQQVDEVLALAEARLDAGNLLSPSNDNARYYYQLALQNDPGNTTARQGLDIVVSKLVLQARVAMDRGNFNDADDLLGDAARIDAANTEVASALSAVATARAAATERERQTQLAADAARQKAVADAEAARLATEQEQATAAAQQPTATVGEPATNDDTVDTAVTEDSSQPSSDPDAEIAPPKAALNAATSEPELTKSNTDSATRESSAFVAISDLKRTKYVAPKYPRNAQRRNVSGWVDVVFTVSSDGTTKDVEIRDSEPGELFINAARAAVSRWEFEPVLESGVVVEKRAGVRLMFALED